MSPKGRKKKDSPDLASREILEVLDEKGRPIALLPRGLIHEQRLRHRAVHVFLFDAEGRLYLQKRASTKDEHPGLWDSSAAGHISPGEPVLMAARRELQEELGLLCNLLQVLELEACPETGWEFVTLLAGVTEREPQPNPTEIEEGRFVKIEDLEKWLSESPQHFTPAFRLLWKLYRDKGSPKPSL